MKTTKLNIGGIAISIENSDPTSNKSPVLAKSSEEYLMCATEAITLANVTAAVLQDMGTNGTNGSMSREGFGEKAKAVAKKTIEAIVNFFKKIIEWCKNLIGFISQKIKSKFYDIEMNKIFKSLTKEEWDASLATLKGNGAALETDVVVIDENNRKKLLNEVYKILNVLENESKVSNDYSNLFIEIGRKSADSSTRLNNEFLKQCEDIKITYNNLLNDKGSKTLRAYDLLSSITYGTNNNFSKEYSKLENVSRALTSISNYSIPTIKKVLKLEEIMYNNIINKEEKATLEERATRYNNALNVLRKVVTPATNILSYVTNGLFKQEVSTINNKIKASKMVVAVVRGNKNIGKESILSNIDSVWDNL